MEEDQAKGIRVPVVFLRRIPQRSITQAQSHQLSRSLMGRLSREEVSWRKAWISESLEFAQGVRVMSSLTARA